MGVAAGPGNERFSATPAVCPELLDAREVAESPQLLLGFEVPIGRHFDRAAFDGKPSEPKGSMRSGF